MVTLRWSQTLFAFLDFCFFFFLRTPVTGASSAEQAGKNQFICKTELF
jgi:hypothetical protein